MDPNASKSLLLDRYKEDDEDIEEISRIEESELLQSPRFRRLQSSPPRSAPSSPSKSKNNENTSMFEAIPDLQWKSPNIQLLRTPTKPKRTPLEHNNRRDPSQSKFLPSSPTKIHSTTQKRQSSNNNILPEMRVSLTPAQRLEKRPGRLLTTNDILSTYEFKENVGKGAFANVYRAINKITGDEVAVKEIFIEDDDNILELMSEIDLLKVLKHKNIVKYHGFIRNEKKLFIFLEYCSGGSLRNLYKNSGPLAETSVISYIKQVLHGLIYLHDQGVVHRDVKAANILLTNEGHIKLTDFGVSTKVSSNTIKTYSIAGTPNWMAPEIISMDGTSTASDIWSVGATVVELLAGEPLYAHLNEMAALHAIVTDEYPPIPQFISEQCKDFLMKCFEKQPAQRLTAKDLIAHEWLTTDIKSPGRLMDSIVLRHRKKLAGEIDNDFNSIKRFNTRKFLPMDTKTFKHTENSNETINAFIEHDLAQDFEDLNLDKSKYSTNLFDPMTIRHKANQLESLIHEFWENPYDIGIVKELNSSIVKDVEDFSVLLNLDFLSCIYQALESKTSYVELLLEYFRLLQHTLKSSDLLIHDFTDLGGIPLLTRFCSSRHDISTRHAASSVLSYLFEANEDTLRVFIQCGGLKASLKLLQEDFNHEQKLPRFIVDSIHRSFEQSVAPKNVLQVILLSFPSFLDWIAVLLMHSINTKDEILSDTLISIICHNQRCKLLDLKPIFLSSSFKIHSKLSKVNQVKLLKFYKSLNVNDLVDSIGMMRFLMKTITRTISSGHSDTDILNLSCSLLFSMCHLNHERQVELIKLDVIPVFQELLNTTLPCTEFVIPLLCEFAMNGNLISQVMDAESGLLGNYLELLIDPIWQANVLDSLVSLHERVNDDSIAKLLLDDEYQFFVQSFLVENSLNYELYMERLVRFLSTYPKSIVVNRIRLLLLTNDEVVRLILQRIKKYRSDLVIQINLFKLLKLISQNNHTYDNYTRIVDFVRSLKKTNTLLVDQLIGEIVGGKTTDATMMRPPPGTKY